MSDPDDPAEVDGQLLLPGSPVDPNQIAQIVLNQLQINQDIRLPIPLPDPQQAAQLRELAPEAYAMWLRIAEERSATENYMQQAQYRVPEQMARSGRPWAFASLLVILAFCGFVATQGTAGVWIGGVIAAFDMVALLGAFLNQTRDAQGRPEPERDYFPPEA